MHQKENNTDAHLDSKAQLVNVDKEELRILDGSTIKIKKKKKRTRNITNTTENSFCNNAKVYPDWCEIRSFSKKQHTSRIKASKQNINKLL